MSITLDEAFERMAVAGFELPNGFVNHGPMACEALAVLSADDELDAWSRRFARAARQRVDPITPSRFEWRDALGSYERLGEWIGYFRRVIEDDGWPQVVGEWVPRLLPGLVVRLFHGAIRTAHALRAISAADTAPRRAELARSLGYWAACFDQGQPVRQAVVADDVRAAVLQAAAEGARWYLAQPDIFFLHGVTAAMAVELFVDHLSADAALAGLAQLQAEHASLYRGTELVREVRVAGIPSQTLVHEAAASRDPHAVKLVEACLRGFAATQEPAFAAAAEVVVGTGAERVAR